MVRVPDVLCQMMDSNHRRQKPTDLQSVPFGRSGNLARTSFGASQMLHQATEETTNRLLTSCFPNPCAPLIHSRVMWAGCRLACAGGLRRRRFGVPLVRCAVGSVRPWASD